MSQKFVIVKRKNPLRRTEPAKCYAQAVSLRTVDTEEVIRRIAERSSFSIGELRGTITEFLLEIKNLLEMGQIVALGDLGRFRLTIVTSKPTAEEKDFTAAGCIGKARVRFFPGKMLRNLCQTMEFTLHHPEEKRIKPTDPVKPGKDDEAPDPKL
ncbi:MAG: DNA-binding protein [Bacteroidia bacterium]|nr:DNA-binding protein [Bacteroidia bacterium]